MNKKLLETCDCSCHPHNGLVEEQKRWQFGFLELKNETVPCWCCWCHYED